MLRTIVVLAALAGVAVAQIGGCQFCQPTTQRQAYDKAELVAHVRLNTVRSQNGFNFYTAQPIEVFKPQGFIHRNITIKQSTDITCGGPLLFTGGEYLVAAKRDGADFTVTTCTGIPLIDNATPVGSLLWSTVSLNPQWLTALKSGFTQSSMPMLGSVGQQGSGAIQRPNGQQQSNQQQPQQQQGGMSSSSNFNSPSGSFSSSSNTNAQNGASTTNFNTPSGSFSSNTRPQSGDSSASFNSQQGNQGGQGSNGGSFSSSSSSSNMNGINDDSSSSFNSQGPLGNTQTKTSIGQNGATSSFSGPLGDQKVSTSLGNAQQPGGSVSFNSGGQQ